jgi:hypothetical protein
MIMGERIKYWESAGPQNTDGILDLALERAKEKGIKNIVFASTRGETAKKLLKRNLEGLNVVCVTHQAGFRSPGEVEMDESTREFLKSKGIKVLTTAHLFGSLGRAVRLKFGGLYPDEIVANTLRIFGEGMKVVVEIACMALDAGLIPYEKEVISIGGTGKGADTAVILLPAHGKNFFDTKVLEIICKPRK